MYFSTAGEIYATGLKWDHININTMVPVYNNNTPKEPLECEYVDGKITYK